MSNKKKVAPNTRHRQSDPMVQPYQQTPRKRSKTSEIEEEVIPLSTKKRPTINTRPSVSANQNYTQNANGSHCRQCNNLMKGLHSPLANFIHGEMFMKAVKEMQMSHSIPEENHRHYPSTSPSRQTLGHICENCHSLEFELSNANHTIDEFNMSAITRTFNQATSASPDYVAFHGHMPNNSNKCFSNGIHLRNSLFRDMRNHNRTNEWHQHSHDWSNCYTYKDNVPYAPFALEPTGSEPTGSVQEPVSSGGCTRCKEMSSDSFKRVKANNNQWNPYPMNDSFIHQWCRRCYRQGQVCKACKIWCF